MKMSESVSVTLETKCWEGDWERLLKTDWLLKLAERNSFPFTERVIMINNVTDYEKVCSYAEQAVKQGWITRYVVVKDYAEEALEFFQLTPQSLGKGYIYSIAELVSIYLCRTEFLLHFAGDTTLHQPCDWIPCAISLMSSDSRIKVANLTWNENYLQAKAESSTENDDFYLGYGFSDQSYLIKTTDFREPIYNETNVASERYPAYGGELFEKRVDSWMRNHQYLRATYKHGSYIHETRPLSLMERLERKIWSWRRRFFKRTFR
jgi:hypothetical protein